MSSRVVHNPAARIWAFDGSPEVRRLAIIVAAAVIVMAPALIFGVPSNRDLSNHFRFALPFYDSIVSGNFYPGWLAESNSGYGDPSFRFYPPALYYVISIFRFLTSDWYVATLLTFVAISVVGSLGMYFWAKSILPSSTAMWASLFFALAPYHVNQLYQATMLAEWAGTALLPFVFGFTERVCADGKRRDIAGLAATYALLVLTHLPLTVIGSIALLVYLLARLASLDRQTGLKTMTKVALAVGLGLCASSIYWLTMVSEMGWIGINEKHHDASVDYRLNFILSTLSPDNLNVWWMNVLALMTLLLFVPAFLLIRKRTSINRNTLRPVVVLTCFALFMTLPPSRPIWRMLPPLQQTQFPWRWLAIISMSGALVAAAAIPLLAKSSQARVVRILIFGALAISLAFTLSHSVREAQYLNRLKFENTLTEVRGTSSVNYWFPIWAQPNPRPMASEVEAADRTVTINSWLPERRKFFVNAGTQTEARVRTFYYPHWVATSEGHVLTTRPDTDGALLISLPKDSASVELEFREPVKSRVSTIASLAGFLFIGLLPLPGLRRQKR